MSSGHPRRRTGANDSFAPRREKPGRGGLRKNRTTTNRRTVAKVLRRRMTARGQHLNSVDDRTRDAWLKEQGFRVLRFWDNEVLTNLPSVLEKITSYISPSPP